MALKRTEIPSSSTDESDLMITVITLDEEKIWEGSCDPQNLVNGQTRYLHTSLKVNVTHPWCINHLLLFVD